MRQSPPASLAQPAGHLAKNALVLSISQPAFLSPCPGSATCFARRRGLDFRSAGAAKHRENPTPTIPASRKGFSGKHRLCSLVNGLSIGPATAIECRPKQTPPRAWVFDSGPRRRDSLPGCSRPPSGGGGPYRRPGESGLPPSAAGWPKASPPGCDRGNVRLPIGNRRSFRSAAYSRPGEALEERLRKMFELPEARHRVPQGRMPVGAGRQPQGE